MRLAIVTCLWQRAVLERFTLEYWSRLTVPGIELEIVAVGSEGDASRSRCPQEAIYTETDNLPLGRKHNVGLATACLVDPDAVMTLNSDNLINADAISHICRSLKDADWVQPHGVYMWDVLTDRLMYAYFDTGAGRVYSRRLLDRLEWELWPDEANVKLDGQAQDRIIQARGRRYEAEPGGAILDIKTATNMWTWDDINAILQPAPIDTTATDLLRESFGIERSQMPAFALAPDQVYI